MTTGAYDADPTRHGMGDEVVTPTQSEPPLRGEFCRTHWSWLCQEGTGQCDVTHVCRPPYRTCQEIGCLPGTVRAAVRLLAYFSDHGGGQMEPLPDCDSCPQCAAWELVESLSKAVPR